MFLSKRPNGFYYIFYKNDKQKYTCASTKCKSKSEALKFLTEFQSQLERRNKEKVKYISLKEFIFEYLKYSEFVHSPKHTESVKATFSVFQRFSSNISLADVSSEIIQSFIDTRIQKKSTYTIRRDIANFSTAFNWGVSKKYLLDNPAKSIKKPRLIERQPIFFDEQSFESFVRTIDLEDLRDLVLFAVNSGLRQGELISLEWNQIDFRDRLIILDNRNTLTKSKRIRTIPLNLNSFQVLQKRQSTSNSELIFTLFNKRINPDYLSRKFKVYIKSAGLNTKLTFHSLRHTFASWLVQRGVSIYQVSKLLGHSNIKVTEIYSHLRAEDLRESINKLNN